MSTRIDKILSPTRLRKNWQLPGKSSIRESDVNEERPEPFQIIGRLLQLVGQQYSEGDAQVLSQLLVQSQQLLERKYLAAGKAPQAADISTELDSELETALDEELDEIITQIEDLVEAFEIDGRGR